MSKIKVVLTLFQTAIYIHICIFSIKMNVLTTLCIEMLFDATDENVSRLLWLYKMFLSVF